MQKYFVPLFEKYKVPLVLAGHDHHYERTIAVNGVTYIVSGAGGRGTRPTGESWFTAVARQVSHFSYIDVRGDTLTFHAIDGSGAEFDTLKLKLP